MKRAPMRHSLIPPTQDGPVRIEPGVYYYRGWQNVSLGVWVGQATVRAVHGLFEFGWHMVQRYPDGHSSVVFILDKLPAPAPEARELLGQMFGAGSPLACSAVILEGSGFWASGLRAMITNTHRTASSNARGAPSKVKLRIGTTLDEVLTWFPAEHARSTGLALDVQQLRSELLDVRDHGAKAALQGEAP